MQYALSVAMITGEEVKAARKRLGENQAQFAARFGVDQSTLHRWENKGVPEHGAAKLAVERVLRDIEDAPA